MKIFRKNNDSTSILKLLLGPESKDVEIFTTNTGLTIFKTTEEGVLHLSVSHKHRLPNWEEIKQLRYELMPDEMEVAMLLPPKRDYVNVHENCFHLYELKEGKLIKAESENAG